MSDVCEEEWRNNLVLLVLSDPNNLQRRLAAVVESVQNKKSLIKPTLHKLSLVNDSSRPRSWVLVKDDDEEEYIVVGCTTGIENSDVKALVSYKCLDLFYVADQCDHNSIAMLKYVFTKLQGRIHKFIWPIPEILDPANREKLLSTLSSVKNFQIVSDLAFSSSCNQQENREVNQYYLVHPPLHKCAFVKLCDKDLHRLGAAADFQAFSGLCDPAVVRLTEPHNITDTSKEEFKAIFRTLYDEGIDRVFVYYAGCSQNGEGTEYPELIFSDGIYNQPTIRSIIESIGFSMVIFGYDSGNTSPKLVSRSGGRIENAYLNSIWDYTGQLYFTGASKGQMAWAGVYSGGVFTQNLIHYLRTRNGDWLAALQDVKDSEVTVENTTLNPYLETNHFVSTPREKYNTWTEGDLVTR